MGKVKVVDNRFPLKHIMSQDQMFPRSVNHYLDHTHPTLSCGEVLSLTQCSCLHAPLFTQ